MRIFFFIFLLLLSTVSYADPEWEFVRLGEQVQLKPSWQMSQGTAQVRIEGGKIQINAFDILGPMEPSLIIEGIIDSSGNISATGVRTHSDEAPFHLRGTLRTWSEEQTWGGRKVLVTFKEILFPLHPHYELYGFISKVVENLPN